MMGKAPNQPSKVVMSKMLVAALFAALFIPILSSSIKRAAESSPEAHSPALIPAGEYNAEPEKLGALVFEHSEGILSAYEVREIAKGLARRKKDKEEWEARLIEGYYSQSEKGSRKR
jgi:hypothetical protein